jgi:hypothetical protein
LISNTSKKDNINLLTHNKKKLFRRLASNNQGKSKQKKKEIEIFSQQHSSFDAILFELGIFFLL